MAQQYLVLRRFWSYGKVLQKGMVVDESEIRSPRIRRSEGKIVPAVSSSTVPEDTGDEVPQTSDPPQGSGDEGDNKAPEEGSSSEEAQPAQQGAAEEPPKKLSFSIKG